MKTKALHVGSKILLVVSAFAFPTLMIGGEIALDNAPMVSSFLNQPTQQIIKDPEAAKKDHEYYKSAFSSVKDEKSMAKRYAETIMAEGATLLKNQKKDGTSALPLKKDAKVSLFSASSVNPVFSGTGAGGAGGETVSLKDGFQEVGLQVNEDLYYWYEDNAVNYGRKTLNGGGGVGTITNVGDASWDEISTPAKTAAADAAIFVLSRTGGEGLDSTIYAKDNKANIFNNNVTFDYKDGNYLKLTDKERDVLTHLVEERDKGTFGSVVLIMNTTNQVELEFLDDIDIDGVLWAGSLGTQGAYAIADILCGNVNPSGKLPDTFWKYHYLNPVHANFGIITEPIPDSQNPVVTQWKTVYENGNMKADGRHIVYQEGIYSGYRYTETRYEDSVLKDKNNVGEFTYNDVVTYPFGYGLSYTNFEYSNFKAVRSAATAENKQRDDVWTLSVDVKNVGNVAGKEAVQIYLQKPYTQYDIDNKIEKAAVELVGFDKTKILEPGQTQTVKVEVEERAFASYDSYGAKTYIVDEGDYHFTAARNSHEAINNILAHKGKTTNDGMTKDGNKDLVATHHIDELDTVKYSKSLINKENDITNQFDSSDLNIYDTTGANKVEYVSRNNWADTVKFGLDIKNNKTGNYVKVKVTEQMKADLKKSWNGKPEEGKGGEYPTYGSTETSYKLVTLRAFEDEDDDPTNNEPIPYDHELWDKLLDQLTWDETVSLLTNGGYGNPVLESIAKPYVIDHDGGNGVVVPYNFAEKNNRGLAVRLNDQLKGSKPIAYPSNAIAAATFNKELMNYYGRMWGEDCLWSGVGGLYGMSMNTHRSPYGGRNFEYYSEDPVLAGQISAEMSKGIRTRGAYTYLKHIGLNDQESYRCGLFTWANEQSVREIYMKPFQITIEDGGAQTVMSSLNSIGTQWAGCHGFLNTVLRDEWGMKGHVVTDTLYAHNGNFARALFYGNDLPLGSFGKENYDFARPTSAGGTGEYGKYARAMREAAHRILYTVSQSFYMNGLASTDKIIQLTPPWISVLQGLQITSGVLFAVGVVAYCFTSYLERKNLK